MWALSSFRRLSFSSSSSSLLSSHGGLKFISYMPSRYAAFTSGGLKNNNGTSPGNVATGGNENMSSPSLLSKSSFQGGGNETRTGGNENMSSPSLLSKLSFQGGGNETRTGGNENMSSSSLLSKLSFQGGDNETRTGGNENMSSPSLLSTLSFQGGGNETQRTSNPMNFISDVLMKDYSQFYRGNLESNADIVHIKLKRNNAFVTVTDSKGNTKLWATSGHKEVAGGGKVSRYAAEATAEYAGRQAKRMGLKSVVVKVNGFSFFKKKRQAILSFREGFTNSRSDQNPIVYIEDTTRRPHNGCRLPKKRRI